jgi:hypothetical protein
VRRLGPVESLHGWRSRRTREHPTRRATPPRIACPRRGRTHPRRGAGGSGARAHPPAARRVGHRGGARGLRRSGTPARPSCGPGSAEVLRAVGVGRPLRGRVVPAPSGASPSGERPPRRDHGTSVGLDCEQPLSADDRAARHRAPARRARFAELRRARARGAHEARRRCACTSDGAEVDATGSRAAPRGDPPRLRVGGGLRRRPQPRARNAAASRSKGAPRAGVECVQVNASPAVVPRRRPRDGVLLHLAGAHPMLACPLPDRRGYRFVCFTRDPRGAAPQGDPSLDELRQAILARRRDGEPSLELTLTEPRWLNRARFQDRVAETLVRGRAVLAGDAAHVWAPVGGHGMNAGMRGAHNLAWKLAAVVRGEAPPSAARHVQRRAAGRGARRHRRDHADEDRGARRPRGWWACWGRCSRTR